MWSVTFIVGFCPRQLLKHLPACRRYPAIVQLVLASSKLTTQARAIRYVNFSFSSRGKGGGMVGAPWPPDSGHSTPG